MKVVVYGAFLLWFCSKTLCRKVFAFLQGLDFSNWRRYFHIHLIFVCKENVENLYVIYFPNFAAIMQTNLRRFEWYGNCKYCRRASWMQSFGMYKRTINDSAMLWAWNTRDAPRCREHPFLSGLDCIQLPRPLQTAISNNVSKKTWIQLYFYYYFVYQLSSFYV